ncbi:uncharacterized protein LOC133195062 [Saccostrea echinata]|uniref:uncharacterized protein LOC133195062 n=1 Tax=Saccostrea echinata TaxID=191078 RepID=UPI002A81A01D|nr:uncharacterized protein LOC133195062 [Saccostrea echinata]
MSGTPLMPVQLQQPAADTKSPVTYHNHQRGQKTESSLPFLKEDQYTDTILLIEGKKLFINRCILGYASPHFQKLLDAANKAALTEKKTKAEVKISDKTYSDFVELLSYLHPATSNDLTEKAAVKLLPLANEYEMIPLKEKCEKVLIGSLRKSPSNPKASKGPPAYKHRRDNAPEILLKCIKSADAGSSKPLLEECVRIFSNPEIPLKDLKASTEISDQVKARIYENRMDNTSNKMSKLANELEKERNEKEKLRSQLNDRYAANTKSRMSRLTRFGSDPSLDKPSNQIMNQVPPAHHHHSHRPSNVNSQGREKFSRFNAK